MTEDGRLAAAVDFGSPAAVQALLYEEQLQTSPAERERLLAAARQWYEAGAEAELRRRTGASEPAEWVTVQDDECDHVEQVSLGGLTVRAGHGAILTSLEEAFDVQTPVEELVTRAVRCADEDHVDWSAARFSLARRAGEETWPVIVALRHHSSAVRRKFAAGILWGRTLVGSGDSDPSASRERGLLAEWATQEPDGDVLANVLDAYTEHDDPGQDTVGLRYAHHPNPRVRREAVWCFRAQDTPFTPVAVRCLLRLAADPDALVRVAVCEVLGPRRRGDDLLPEFRKALLALVRDEDARVRAFAAASLSPSGDRGPDITEALVALLDEDNQLLRLEAAYGLALRDDPGTEEAYERVGPLGPGFEEDHRLSAYWSWTERNRPRQA